MPLTLRIESALAGYVRGQVLLSAIIGTSAGLGVWLLEPWASGATAVPVNVEVEKPALSDVTRLT